VRRCYDHQLEHVVLDFVRQTENAQTVYITEHGERVFGSTGKKLKDLFFADESFTKISPCRVRPGCLITYFGNQQTVSCPICPAAHHSVRFNSFGDVEIREGKQCKNLFTEKICRCLRG